MKKNKVLDARATISIVVALLVLGTSQPITAQPANDDFDNATTVTEPLPFSDQVNTIDATTADDDPDCFGQGPTVWYAYTPSVDILVEANTFGSDYDTALSAYTGTRGDLTQVACNDDSGMGVQSRVTVAALAGETVFFMVGAFFGGMGGELVFAVDEAPPPGPPLIIDLAIDPAGSFDKAGTAFVSGTVTCSKPALVSISGELRQVVGRFVLLGFLDAFVFCDGEASWEAIVSSETGVFRGGQAKISATGFAFDPETDEFAVDSEVGKVQLRGGRKPSGASSSAADIPASISLHSSFPNPFNPQATIRFVLPDVSEVRLAVYDARGRQVQVLIDGSLHAGEHEVTFEAHGLPSGVYFSRLEAGGKTSTSRMVLLK